MGNTKGAWLIALLLAAPMGEGVARACGCFAPPDPTAAVVQSGERIVFSAENGQVTAHIQIQYSGEAKDFGWLLPLPSVPTLEIGSEELFQVLEQRTTPGYDMQKTYPKNCNWPEPPRGVGGCCDMGLLFAGEADAGADPGATPLVYESSIGPYDIAVLKADDKTAMLDWLALNRYFVPAGTEAVLKPYIHAGAYFLALKLKSGQSTGDIQPVVVRYASDLPMIPLVLTSVTSTPVLDVTVYVLGPGRAIPRNYHHVVLDDAALDWNNLRYDRGSAIPGNYMAQVLAAVRESPGHHAFVTERAQKVTSFNGGLFSASRYGDLDWLRNTKDAGRYLAYLKGQGYSFSSVLVGVLAKHIKMPPNLQDRAGTRATPANYFYNFDFWIGRYPEQFVDFDLSYDPVALTDDIEAAVVKPGRAAAALFETASRPDLTLTRLFTRLAPADMNSDPVFSFNPSLGDELGAYTAHLNYRCGVERNTYVGRLKTPQGFEIDELNRPLPPLPAALRIEVLRESGMPEVLTDNRQKIVDLIGPLPSLTVPQRTVTGVGCTVGPASGAAGPAGRRAAMGVALALGLAALLVRRRTRRSAGR